MRSQTQVNLAIARALNHTIAKGKTAASREMREIYNVKAKDIKSALSIKKASRTNLESAIIAMGRPMPLMAFGARQTKHGVSVNVMGQRKVIKGAFIATMKSGHTGVFARGKYAGYNFQFRKERIRKSGNDLTINELTTSSAPKMMSNEIVLNAISKHLESDFKVRLDHEVSRLMLRQGQS